MDGLTINDLFRVFGMGHREKHKGKLSLEQLRAMDAIEQCRTEEMGGNKIGCDNCANIEFRYISCRSRYCSQCGSMAKDTWLNDRIAELLDVSYYHLVFTMPACFERMAIEN
jgi:hypothetical protein